jgi:hypothetical protein
MIDRVGFDPDDVDERDEHECAEAWLKAHAHEQMTERLFWMFVMGAGERLRGLVSMYISEGDSNREVAHALIGLRDAA